MATAQAPGWPDSPLADELFPYFFMTKSRNVILVVSVHGNYFLLAYLEMCFYLLYVS